jgi:hypothetical protein
MGSFGAAGRRASGGKRKAGVDWVRSVHLRRTVEEGSVENPDVGQVGRKATSGPIVNRPAR